ncbi:hypothetical protein KKB55_02035 [Myxococcota bacterium]|nr:hypothetical protein [Myxococcota bacterium]MBU1896532.1 hypothetical protein [Myxococcota bacterium]
MRLALLPVLLLACAEPPLAPPTLRRACGLRVEISLPGAPLRVGLSGDFNGFDAAQTPLAEIAPGRWGISLPQLQGRALYRVEVDGRPYLDPAQPLEARVDGEAYTLAYLEDCQRPSFTLAAQTPGPDRLEVILQLRRAEGGAGLDRASVKATVEARAMRVEIVEDHAWVYLEGLPRGKHALRVEAADAAGRAAEPFEAPFWIEPQPFRWADAIIYQVFLDRFAREAPFTSVERGGSPGLRYGGDLRGALAQLEAGYFEQLGVNVLWISPLNLNPEGLWAGVEGGPPRYESYHAYWPISPRDPDPRFGAEADIEALVAAAHARGIRVLMDIVLNHVHEQHPYVKAHPTWFSQEYCQCGSAACPWFSHIEVCWFTDYLPDVIWDQVETLETQIDDAMYWVERYDLDGLRVDAVPMMPRFVTRALTAALHRRREGLATRHFLLGETFTGPEEYAQLRWYLGPDGLDGQFDFPLMWATRAAFAWESAPLWTLADRWAESAEAWAGSGGVMGVFVGNHDVTRFISEADGQVDGTRQQAWEMSITAPTDPVAYDKLVLAQAFALTVPGAPVLYYGDEYGQPGANDPDNRRLMRFDAERTPIERRTAARISRIGRLRACLPALRRGAWRLLRAEAERLLYLRDLGDAAPAVVILNRDDETPILLKLPDDLALDDLTDALSGQTITRRGGAWAPLSLPPRAPAILLPTGHPCLGDPR